jgi:hypothetical protein
MPFSPKTYQCLWKASLLVTMLLAAWTGISAAGGDRLGLSPQTMAWLGICAGVLGMLSGFLPPLQKTPAQHAEVVRQVQQAQAVQRLEAQSRAYVARQSDPPGPSFSETITPPTPRTSDPS